MAKTDVTFVSGVAVSGFMNGVINLALETAHWLPVVDEKGKTIVSTATEVTANLRFDLRVAIQIRDALTSIIDQNTKPLPEEVN